LFLRAISMNSMLRSSELGQGFTPRASSNSNDGIKLTPDGDNAARPISMVLRRDGRLEHVGLSGNNTAMYK
jgi:hypothetical protein